MRALRNGRRRLSPFRRQRDLSVKRIPFHPDPGCVYLFPEINANLDAMKKIYRRDSVAFARHSDVFYPEASRLFFRRIIDGGKEFTNSDSVKFTKFQDGRKCRKRDPRFIAGNIQMRVFNNVFLRITVLFT